MLLYTPETSGGLLIAVPDRRLAEFTAFFEQEEQPYWVVGCVVAGDGIEVARRCPDGPHKMTRPSSGTEGL
jgi:selenide,water dikinase